MRAMLVALILTIAAFPSAAVAQLPEPYYRPGETPLSVTPSEINPEVGDIAEYDFRLDLVGSDAASSVFGKAVFTVIGKKGGFYALGVVAQLASFRGFPKDVEKQLAGYKVQMTLIFDDEHGLRAVAPPDALDSLFTNWIADYAFMWEFFKNMPFIESGSPILLKDGRTLPVVEARDKEGRRFLQVFMQNPKLPSGSKYLPAPYAPVIEVTLIPSWPLIRSMYVMAGKPVKTHIGPAIPVYTAVLQSYRALR